MSEGTQPRPLNLGVLHDLLEEGGQILKLDPNSGRDRPVLGGPDAMRRVWNTLSKGGEQGLTYVPSTGVILRHMQPTGYTVRNASLRDQLIKLAHTVPETRKHLVPLLAKYAAEDDEDDGTDKEAGREHGEGGKGYGETGPDVRGPGVKPPEAKPKCFYETGDPADRCYTTTNGGPDGARSGPKLKPGDWKGYEEKRWPGGKKKD